MQSEHPASELIAMALLAPEVARQNLRTLLLANPDYFGRIKGNSFKAVLKIEKDTTFERIAGVHYNSHNETLQATIHLNRGKGYSDGKYGNASQEFVRFYLSYDDGSTWRDQGLHAVDVYDMQGHERSRFTVSAGIHPARTFCFMQNPPMVRVILSWNSAPPADAPDWEPVWGEVFETKVRIDQSSAEAVRCEDKREEWLGSKPILAKQEETMHSEILEKTLEASRLKVFGLTEVTEHYRVPNPLLLD
jgi:hypothetical protein